MEHILSCHGKDAFVPSHSQDLSAERHPTCDLHKSEVSLCVKTGLGLGSMGCAPNLEPGILLKDHGSGSPRPVPWCLISVCRRAQNLCVISVLLTLWAALTSSDGLSAKQ